MSRSFLLQDWTTLRSSLNASFVQDPSDWLNLAGFSDVVCWLDVQEVTPPNGDARNFLKLQLETAPSFEDAYFLPIAPPTSVGIQAPYVQPSATPTIVRSAQSTVSNNLMRFLRWNITPSTSGAWDITFRIRSIAARSTTFVPPLIAGCVAWYRPDLGVTVSPGTSSVTNWNDQSGTNDVNKNLATGVSPTLNVSDASYMGQPTISFVRASGQYLKSGGWASPVSQPNTWLIVGNTASTSLGEAAIDANQIGGGQNIGRDGGNNVYTNAGTVFTWPNAWSSASVALIEFNGGSSKIFFNDFTTAKATGPAGAAGQGSLSVASSNVALGAGNYWDGTIAEIIGYSGLLNATAKAQLRQYIRGRYGITVA